MKLEIRRGAWFAATDGLAISAAVLGLHIWLMQRYPIIYGGDPIARLINPSRILNGHQLPLMQALINLALRITYGPTVIFLLMAFISIAGCLGFYALISVLTGSRRAAWTGAILYATHPFILYYSRVPYQEPLLLAGITWGFYFLFRPASRMNRFLASLFFAIACFARYEGWIAALIAAVFEIWRIREKKGRTSFASIPAAAFLFGWAPAIWILWNKDLSPAGSYVLDVSLQWGKLYRLYFISKSALWWTQSAVVLLALLGFVYAWLDSRMRKDARFHALWGAVAMFLVALIFSGHGIDPDPIRILTEREAFFPIAILVLYAGIGADRFVSSLKQENYFLRLSLPIAVLVVLAGYNLNSAFHRVEMSNADPDLKTDYEIAQVLGEKHSRAIILAKPLPQEPIRNYLTNVERWSGQKGKIRAAELLKQAEATPLDYQRVLVYAWMGRENLFSGDRLQGMDLRQVESFLSESNIKFIVVFSDFVPVAEHEKSILKCGVIGRAPEAEIRNNGKVGQVYSVCLPPNAAEPKNPS